MICIERLEQNAEPCSFIVLASLTVGQILQHRYTPAIFLAFLRRNITGMLRRLSHR